MDVVVNAQIQSPLVRTLADTAGKGSSFTHQLKDNVPPISKSKIVVNADGEEAHAYGRTYTFQIPKTGYLYNAVLRIQGEDSPIHTSLMATIYNSLVGLSGSSIRPFANPRTAPGGATAPNTHIEVFEGFVPYEDANQVQPKTSVRWSKMWTRISGGQEIAGTSAGPILTALGAARICPFRYHIRDFLTPNNPVTLPSQVLRGWDMTTFTGSTPDNTNNPAGVASDGARIYNQWDWCTQSNLSRFLGAIIPSKIMLSSHNRPIQSLYPFEVLTRIFSMEPGKKAKYLSMLRPQLVRSPQQTPDLSTTTSTYGVDRQWVCYFPCLFSAFENTQNNLDTLFLENLEIVVETRTKAQIFDPRDLGTDSNAITSNVTFAETYRHDRTGFYNSLPFRDKSQVVSDTCTFNLICYYHHFHEMTSEKIRQSNYKPQQLANILYFDTFEEAPIALTSTLLRQGGWLNVPLQCNNAVFEITFLVRRKDKTSIYGKESVFEDYITTLPIKTVQLIASGQTLYEASGAECLTIDTEDCLLSTMRDGSNISNNSGIYADNFASSHVANKERNDHFFGYTIRFGLSSSREYNSGSFPLQNATNVHLRLEFFNLAGWVIQDDSLASTRNTFFNRTRLAGLSAGSTTNHTDFVADDEFELQVYCNHWKIVQVDSGTGSITSSLAY